MKNCVTTFRGVQWLLLAALLCFGGTPTLSAAPAKRAKVSWTNTRKIAMAQARKTGKPVLIDVGTTWCGPCHMMKNEVFQKPAFAQESKRWVLLKMDGDKHAELARFYGVQAFPTLIVLKPNGKVVARQSGYSGPAATMHFIRRAYKKAKA